MKYIGLNIETALTYSKSFRNSHHFKLQMIYDNRQMEEDNNSSIYTYSDSTYSDGKKTQSYNAFIGLFEYNYKQRYFLRAVANKEYYTINTSGSDYLQYYYIKQVNLFPAITLGWKISNENFLNNLSFINELTLKGGFGIKGNYPGGELLYYPDLLVSDNIEMEKTEEYSLGLDFGLWKNRIAGSITYYYGDTKNAVSYRRLPNPPNIYSKVYENFKWYRNNGLELDITLVPVAKENIKWSSSFNFFKNNNKLINPESNYNDILGGFEYAGDQYYTQLSQQGSPYSVFYLPTIIDYTTSGQPIFNKIGGGKTTSVYQAKYEVMSQPIPKFELGWSNRIQLFQDFELSFVFRYAGAYSIYNATRMRLSYYYDFGSTNISPEGEDNLVENKQTAPICDLYLEDASFLRLENIAISYTIKPKKPTKDYSLKIYAGANNLFTLTNYSGLDPAGYSDGIDYFNVYPLARSYFLGI